MCNAGFTLIELIIVIAILTILVVVIAPSYLKYVEKTRRTVDMDTALKICDAVERVQAIDALGTSSGSLSYTGAVAWNKNTTIADPPATFLDYVFLEVGKVPISVVDNDLFWTMTYDPETGEVSGIYLGTSPGDQKYELFPDGSKWLENGAD